LHKLKGVYVITIENKKLKRSHINVCQAALKGGATTIQYREKKKAFYKMLEEARKIKELCQKNNATFIINDSIELAKIINSDGLHLGQDDEDFKKARRILPGKLIGLSATTLREAINAEAVGADYIGAGPVFATPSKEDAAPPFGLETLAKIKEHVSIPVVAIGGINQENAKSVRDAGTDAIAVISAVSGQKDMTEATEKLVRIIN